MFRALYMSQSHDSPTQQKNILKKVVRTAFMRLFLFKIFIYENNIGCIKQMFMAAK